MSSAKNSDMGRENKYIIAIDGYSSCGKSTFARLIARELNFIYIDSGAMYRAVALYGLQHNMVNGQGIDHEGLTGDLDKISINFRLNTGSGLQETWLNDRNVEEEIRGIEVSNVVSKISQIKAVRDKMVLHQRKIGSSGGVVMDGRDIGSTVFPEAALKIFMTADPQVRAQRRYDELVKKGIETDLEEIVHNIRMRDFEDVTRSESPLRKASDALILDNSNMTVEQQMNWFRKKWHAVINHDEN
jgi:cytidylate kinase